MKIRTTLNQLFALAALMGSALAANTQTLVSGSVSGTWTPAGNPFAIVDNSTVPAGQTLKIQPGVVVWIGSNVTFTVNGSLQAIGTPDARITVRSPIPSQYWNSILLNYSSATNRLKYCDFERGTKALSFRVFGVDDTMRAEVMNCTFSNCLDAAIYGESEGAAYNSFGTIYELDPVLSPHINNCVFANCGDGCRFYVLGRHFVGGGIEVFIGYGRAAPRMVGNIFSGLAGAALNLTKGPDSGSSTAEFINNTVVACRIGVSTLEPWDAKVQSSIFVGCSNGVAKQGSLSATISYNGFYSNTANFSGYPSTFGQVIINNRSGTPCDLLQNIFEDPRFAAPDDFHLATNSKCIDAGTSDPAFCDMCFPPALGSQFPDLGAYGGPDACNWLDVVPKLPVAASMSKSNNVIRLSWPAIPRSTYQVQCVTNILTEDHRTGPSSAVSMMTNTWLDLTNGRVLATEKPTSLIVATNTSQNKVFFRVQSLGRTPGN